jgi:hypothetical protein
MIGTLWTRKQQALMVAAVTLACAAGFLSTGLAQPRPASSAGLGVEWQCSKTAGVLTVCTKVLDTRPVSNSSREDPAGVRPV